MWENRISSHFQVMAEQAPTSMPRPQALPPQPIAGPHMVQRADIYQVARARAEFEHELGKLFNPGASAE
jgi:hypothetical protein